MRAPVAGDATHDDRADRGMKGKDDFHGVDVRIHENLEELDQLVGDDRNQRIVEHAAVGLELHGRVENAGDGDH